MKVLKERHLRYKKERKYSLIVSLIVVILLFGFNFAQSGTYYSAKVKYQYFKKEVSELILKRPDDISLRHAYFSAAFLGTPYKANTLSGDDNNKEIFTINLNQMDCFTYIDYVHSLIEAKDYYNFINKLQNVRYKDGIVSFKNRNHFFYDWSQNVKGIVDATDSILPGKSIRVLKNLNLKSNGELFLDGIPIRRVHIRYIPPDLIKESNLNNLKSGDYIGIYTDIKGLDVSHVGILIKNKRGVFFRHASSSPGIKKVIDVEFLDYIKNKPGIVVYRK